MSGDHERAGFEALAAAGAEDDAARALTAKLKSGPGGDLKALAALWLHCAVAAPERTVAIFDASAEGWLGKPVDGPAVRIPAAPPEIVPAAFWAGLWDLTGEPRPGLEAVNLTTKTAALSGMVSPAIVQRVARAAMIYPGVSAAAAQGEPKRWTIEQLGRCPTDSMAGILHKLVTENGFELEPLDRDTLGLEKLPPPLPYLNARILQCHDLWHIVGGYQTTALHEVAISGFQLAQFGHHYSGMFLAMVMTRLAFERPEGGPILLETILKAWVHGRVTPPLLPVKWEKIWDLPLSQVRAKLGVTPYASPFPADLFEQLNIPADAA